MNSAAQAALAAFPWPMVPSGSGRPAWVGDGFSLEDGTKGLALLQSTSDSGWSDALNRLLEENGNEQHPITVESRRQAVQALGGLSDIGGATVLEIGSSSPGFLNYVAARRPDLALIGSDFLASSARGFVANATKIPFVQLNIMEHGLQPGCVDAVIMLNVLEHIENDKAAVSEAYRLLKPGGVLHLEVPAGPALFDYYDAWLKHYRRYNGLMLRGLLPTEARLVAEGALGRWAYLPFWIVKKWNRAHPPVQERVPSLVEHMNRATSHSILLSMLFAMDRAMPLPWGIRRWLTAIKPTTQTPLGLNT